MLCNIALSFMRHIWGLLDLSVFNHMWSVPIFELDGFTIMKLNSKFKNDHAEIGV